MREHRSASSSVERIIEGSVRLIYCCWNGGDRLGVLDRRENCTGLVRRQRRTLVYHIEMGRISSRNRMHIHKGSTA